MKTIKNLTVTVNYTVSLRDVKVSDEDYEAFKEFQETPAPWVREDDGIYEWLCENIEEDDAFAFEFEVDELDFEDELSSEIDE